MFAHDYGLHSIDLCPTRPLHYTKIPIYMVLSFSVIIMLHFDLFFCFDSVECIRLNGEALQAEL